MKLRIRRVGNSLGVIIPKSTLEEWGRGEGESLELVGRHIRVPGRTEPKHEALDELKRRLALAVVTHFAANLIRAHSLANLHRWKAQDSWVSAYDEWKAILESGDDGELFATMLGRDERSNRLRQSPPYVGLLPREEMRELNEEASEDLEALTHRPRPAARRKSRSQPKPHSSAAARFGRLATRTRAE